MSINTIRRKLHSYLEVAEEKKVKAIYAIMENEIEAAALKYSDEIKSELDHRHATYINGKAKIITAEDSRKRIQMILNPSLKK